MKNRIKLSPLISDGAVLQRNRKNKIWGLVKSKSKEGRLAIHFAGAVIRVPVKADGSFEAELLPMPAGGPYDLFIELFENTEAAAKKPPTKEILAETVIVRNLMIGDVWLLCGQSNMELPVSKTLDLYADEVKGACNPAVRIFDVPQEFDFHGPVEELEKGSWIPVTPESVYQFSALGYFFAEYVNKEEQVPVGLLQAGVAGAHIEAFIAEDGLLTAAKSLREAAGEKAASCGCDKNDSCKYCYEQRLTQDKDDEYVVQTMAKEAERLQEWEADLRARDIGLNEQWYQKESLYPKGEERNAIKIPGIWDEAPEYEALAELRGSVWTSRRFVFPAHLKDKEAKLWLGTLLDADETYLNGTLLGNTDYRYPQRRYPVPAGVLREGKNVLTVRITAKERAGGFVPQMPYYLECGGEKIELDGEWEYRIGTTTEPSPGMTFFLWHPCGLYNQMLYPLRKLQIKGMIFYQGESNTRHASDYEGLFRVFIEGIRELFCRPSLPVVFIQLPFYGMEDDERGTDNWTRLREAQKQASDIPDTAMVDIYDLGFRYELHPQNKKEVAKRVWSAVKNMDL